MKPITERTTIGEILELSSTPTLEEIKANYKRLVKQYHPDKNKSPEAVEYMKKINKAYALATGKEVLPPQPPPVQQQGVVIIRWGWTGGTSTSNGTGGGWYW